MTVWLTNLEADVKFLTAILVGPGRPDPPYGCAAMSLDAARPEATPYRDFGNSVNSVEKTLAFLTSL